MNNLSSSNEYRLSSGSRTRLMERQQVVLLLKAPEDQTLQDQGYESLLLDAVDDALGWLGDSAKQTIYRHLEKVFGIRRKDIPLKIEEFTSAIETIFGAGAALLEIQIMKKLHKKVGGTHLYFPEPENLVFIEYVKSLEFSYLNKLT